MKIKIGDKGKYLSINQWLPCEIIGINECIRNAGNDIKIKILDNPHYRCRKITNIKSLNFIKDN